MSNFQIQREGYEGTVTPSDSTLLKLAVVVALQRVGEEILHKRAVLLTTVFSEFLNTMCTDTCTPALRESLTARWLLGKIARKLSPHLAFSCSCRKIGTVLYRSGGDLIYSLSLALSNVQQLSKDLENKTTENSMLKAQLQEKTNTQVVIRQAACHLNKIIHKDISRLTSMTSVWKAPMEVLDTSIAKVRETIDPMLWEFITTLTQTVRGCRGIKNPSEIGVQSVRKPIRQLYCLSVVMFCINPRCNVPFHLQLTDTILIHGGTLELVQIFNHIGAVASLETHEDLLKAVAKARKEHGVHRELTPNAFQVVTRDNLDIIYTKPCSGVYISVLQDKAGMEHLVSVLNPYQFQVSLKQPNPPLRLWMQEHFHLSY